MMKNAKEYFEANNETFYDQFEYDGTNLTIKQGSILLNNDGSFIKEYQDDIFGKFVTKVISVNKKIGKAVVRNRIKRQVRSIISQIEIKNNIDLFIIVRSKVLDIDFNEMNKQILFLLRKQKTI